MTLTSLMRKRQRKNRSGFTLIEVLVVLAIIGFMVVIAAQKLRSPNQDMKKIVRDLAALSRSLHNRAKLQNVTFRLALEINAKEPDKIWAEVSNSKVLFETKKEEKGLFDDEDDEKKSLFSIDKRAVRGGKQEVPNGFEITSVEYARSDEVIDSGMAYVHFLPEGLVEETAIHLSAGAKLKWTIAIHPITGKVDIYTSDISIKEIRAQ
ncbi:MAG: type II secretion system protein [Pseudomonadota bacterium]|nr:type II secretion system protein [Pseudomonadota bacterium]